MIVIFSVLRPVEIVKAKDQEFRRISEQDLRKMFFLFKILIEKNR